MYHCMRIGFVCNIPLLSTANTLLHTLYAGNTSSVCGTAKQLSLSNTTALISTSSSLASSLSFLRSRNFDLEVAALLRPKARDSGIGRSANVETVACGRQRDGSRATRKRERMAGMFIDGEDEEEDVDEVVVMVEKYKAQTTLF
jgi:hypothetical protein